MTTIQGPTQDAYFHDVGNRFEATLTRNAPFAQYRVAKVTREWVEGMLCTVVTTKGGLCFDMTGGWLLSYGPGNTYQRLGGYCYGQALAPYVRGPRWAPGES